MTHKSREKRGLFTCGFVGVDGDRWDLKVKVPDRHLGQEEFDGSHSSLAPHNPSLVPLKSRPGCHHFGSSSGLVGTAFKWHLNLP